jgi:hypothetical protein
MNLAHHSGATSLLKVMALPKVLLHHYGCAGGVAS